MPTFFNQIGQIMAIKITATVMMDAFSTPSLVTNSNLVFSNKEKNKTIRLLLKLTNSNLLSSLPIIQIVSLNKVALSYHLSNQSKTISNNPFNSSKKTILNRVIKERLRLKEILRPIKKEDNNCKTLTTLTS